MPTVVRTAGKWGNAMRIVFVVPAFNEAGAIPGVVADLRAHFPAADIAVINDGSTDATAQVARQLGVHVLDLPINLGIGGAVQTGLLFADRHDYDIAIQFDGDGQHQADQVFLLLEALADPVVDVAIGSRFLEPNGYQAPPLRRLGIAVLRSVSSLLIGQRVTDTTSGFRAYKRGALRFLAGVYPHDYPEPETVVTLRRQGFYLREVAVMMRERQSGLSSITMYRSFYYMLKVLLAIVVGASRRSVRQPLGPQAGEIV
jgi:glycosyltransferase involved in cell wall biosynthesis